MFIAACTTNPTIDRLFGFAHNMQSPHPWTLPVCSGQMEIVLPLGVLAVFLPLNDEGNITVIGTLNLSASAASLSTFDHSLDTLTVNPPLTAYFIRLKLVKLNG